MKEENIDINKEMTIEEGKTPVVDTKETIAAPKMDETVNPSIEDIDDTLMILNIMDEETGGKGGITKIPEELKNSIGYLIKQLEFMRDLFEDPDWKAILDDMADQKEDGKTPSVEVAIARTMPLDRIKQIADTEGYEEAQNELSGYLDNQRNVQEEETELQANFAASQKAGEEYAKQMGYDEDRKNQLFQKVINLHAVMADGKLTVEEFREVDKMLNYGPDTEALKAQIEGQGVKEVLPDQASIESAMPKGTKATPEPTGPGLGSVAAYQSPMTDITRTGAKRFGRK